MKCLLIYCLCSLSLLATEYQLRTELVIDRAQLYVGDVLQTGDYPDRVAATPLQRLAGNGPYTIKAARVYQELRKAGLWQSQDRVSGTCQVRRAVEIISASDFEQAVRQDIQERLKQSHSTARIVVQQAQAAKELQVITDNDHAYELQPEPLQHGLAGRVPYRVKVMRGRFELGSCFMHHGCAIALPGLHRSTTIASWSCLSNA